MLRVEKDGDVVKTEFKKDISPMMMGYIINTVLLHPIRLVSIEYFPSQNKGNLTILCSNKSVLHSSTAEGCELDAFGKLSAELTDWINNYEIEKGDYNACINS